VAGRGVVRALGAPSGAALRGGLMSATSPEAFGLGLFASIESLVPLPLNRISVPARRGTVDDTISESVARNVPETWIRSGPGLPSTRTGTFVTYSLRIT